MSNLASRGIYTERGLRIEIERLTTEGREREKWIKHAAHYCHGHALTCHTNFEEAWKDYEEYLADDDSDQVGQK